MIEESVDDRTSQRRKSPNKFSNFKNQSEKNVFLHAPVKKISSDQLSDDRTNTFMDDISSKQLEVDIANANIDIPEIMKPESYKPEVVEAEKNLVRDENYFKKTLNESMKMIDFSLPV